MKKFFAAILAILYLGTSMGMTVHLHYCMGKLVSWGLVDHEAKYCMTCGMAMKSRSKAGFAKKDCCKDEQEVIQSDKDQKASQADYSWLAIAQAATTAPDGHFSLAGVPALAIEYPNTNAPPGSGPVPLFLRHRNFRI